MPTVYKLLVRHKQEGEWDHCVGFTYNGYMWQKGVKAFAEPKAFADHAPMVLCTQSVLHSFPSLEHMTLWSRQSIPSRYTEVWKAESSDTITDGKKCGSRELTLVEYLGKRNNIERNTRKGLKRGTRWYIRYNAYLVWSKYPEYKDVLMRAASASRPSYKTFGHLKDLNPPVDTILFFEQLSRMARSRTWGYTSSSSVKADVDTMAAAMRFAHE